MNNRLLKRLLSGYGLALAFALAFSSCKRDISTEELTAKKDSNYVSSADVAKLAEKVFLSPQSGRLRASAVSKSAAGRKVSALKEYKAADGKNVLYIVNYAGGGFAILSADKRTPAVLAYSENNTFKTDTVLPQGLQTWLNETKNYITGIRAQHLAYKGQDTLIVPTRPKASGGTVAVNKLPPPPPPPNYCEDSYSYRGPLMQTNWGQQAGYNNNFGTLPSCTLDYYNYGHAYTGCVATAMGQIMRYHQYPASYNYSVMPNKVTFSNYTSTGTNEMSRLLYNAALSVGMVPTCTGSNAYTSDVPNALKYTFGYASDVSQIDVSNNATFMTKVMQQIDMGRPVLLSGVESGQPTGHAWVCDGYMLSNYCVGDGMVATYVSFHMNWGWGEIYQDYDPYNGYYVASYMNGNGHVFNTQQRAVINIHH
ncbi:hypothetical protein D0C36_16220 [Mucilaginibacter conchicola]|uniref:Spi protease inhibitor domain-containing protein n=1 Tax=Mucilaginibacter conchicola TaxID=2303333 RepID=A0A372NUI7_9SPHI|nr:C10 family peptidase [Mucilaginibacter conchicola]RFZ92933.1 hypothetical protein D0C36_16220 [Mucilaginibacter conchicola]